MKRFIILLHPALKIVHPPLANPFSPVAQISLPGRRYICKRGKFNPHAQAIRIPKAGPTGHDDGLETFEQHPHFVLPAQAGKRSLMFIIQKLLKRLDSRLHGNEELPNFKNHSKVSLIQNKRIK
jgi:hypothetical protein